MSRENGRLEKGVSNNFFFVYFPWTCESAFGTIVISSHRLVVSVKLFSEKDKKIVFGCNE